jgi:predicted TIM-barrel fold metal-dependent hydrolase
MALLRALRGRGHARKKEDSGAIFAFYAFNVQHGGSIPEGRSSPMPHAFFPPSGACDCHVHVVGPKRQFPLAARRSYTPMDAPLAELRAMLARLGLERVVIVQPSFYGFDNSCMVAALEELGLVARGVAAVAPGATPAEIDALHRAGVRGIRLNMASLGTATAETLTSLLRDTATLCERHAWHIQLFVHAEIIPVLAKLVGSLEVPVVIDHFGLVRPADGEGPAARALLDLLGSGRVWVKLSAPYRIADDLDDPRIGAFVQRLLGANPECLVWGSDWPHTPKHGASPVHDDREMPYREIDTKRLLQRMATWCPEPRRLEDILVRNPARLYDFPMG